MDCAFDDAVFDNFSFDTCAPQPAPQIFPSRGSGGGRKRIVIYNPPVLDDDDVLLAWLALEELI